MGHRHRGHLRHHNRELLPCHRQGRHVHNYKVAFLSDLTGTFDYPDVGHGALSADDVHRTTLSILAFSTAHVMAAAEFSQLVDASS